MDRAQPAMLEPKNQMALSTQLTTAAKLRTSREVLEVFAAVFMAAGGENGRCFRKARW
jgi:hypothetical protein